MVELLTNPNVAYLFLVGGVLLAMLSLATPGTGFFEVGAFFCIALAGYAIYNNSFNSWALLLLALSIIPFVYAIRGARREIYLGLSILLLVVGSVFMFPRTEGQAGVHPLLALIASGLVSVFLWVAVSQYVKVAVERPAHDIEGLIGQTGEAKTKIHAEGSVQVAGELWSARSEKNIPVGSSIRVVRREGFILVVEKSE